MTGETAPASRIATLDAVRGFAVMGILLLNIVDMGMPGYAYIDPNFYGGAEGANWWTWATVYVLFDGKMRGLFTMMFGASTLLIAERAAAKGESPAYVHFSRMAALFVIGMVHAYLIWSGDILVLYSLCGAAMFFAWRLSTKTLLLITMTLMLGKLAFGLTSYGYLHDLERRAALPNAPAATVKEWTDFSTQATPSVSTVPEELAAYRGTWLETQRARAAFTVVMQTVISPLSIPDTLALIAFGMALFRSGFFSGEWARRDYWRVVLAGFGITVPLYIPLVMWIQATSFSAITLSATEAIHLTLLRPLLSMAWASLVILFVTSGLLSPLATRLAAAGRMAFSNYLGTSILTTTFFYGYGFGWFGYLLRIELYWVVLAVWAIILLWSKPWLDRFRYGPFEWLWRSLARGTWQPMKK
ncbi:MAG: DUF418 domain-containing protein [Pseudomonadota bacterium]